MTCNCPWSPSCIGRVLVAAAIALAPTGCGGKTPAPDTAQRELGAAGAPGAGTYQKTDESKFHVFVANVNGTVKPYVCPDSDTSATPRDMEANQVKDTISSDNSLTSVTVELHDYCTQQLSSEPSDCKSSTYSPSCDGSGEESLSTTGCDIASNKTISAWSRATTRSIGVPSAGSSKTKSFMFCIAKDTDSTPTCPSKDGDPLPSADRWCSPDPIMIVDKSGSETP